jgi:hypothetical protein
MATEVSSQVKIQSLGPAARFGTIVPEKGHLLSSYIVDDVRLENITTNDSGFLVPLT